MTGKDAFDDDYVAKVLAEDAKKTSHNYAAQALSALLPRRTGGDAPKPNTRFLSHIVREADHHNAALKRKEEREAERRLRALREDEGPARKRRRADEPDESKRKRLLNDILDTAGHRSDRHVRHRDRKHSSHSFDRRKGSRHTREGRSDQISKGRRSHERNDSNRKRRRSSSPYSGDSRDEAAPQRGRPSQRRTRERDATETTLGAGGHSSTSKLTDPYDQPTKTSSEASQVRKRGRGAQKQKSGIDDRFAADYDPSQDVSLDSGEDGDDWDMALEAMRDRARYRRHWASRMREAGFADEEIAHLEQGVLKHEGAHEAEVTTVKWSKKGEPRAWDAGKVEALE